MPDVACGERPSQGMGRVLFRGDHESASQGESRCRSGNERRSGTLMSVVELTSTWGFDAMHVLCIIIDSTADGIPRWARDDYIACYPSRRPTLAEVSPRPGGEVYSALLAVHLSEGPLRPSLNEPM